jgi:hypothetical protein
MSKLRGKRVEQIIAHGLYTNLCSYLMQVLSFFIWAAVSLIKLRPFGHVRTKDFSPVGGGGGLLTLRLYLTYV